MAQLALKNIAFSYNREGRDSFKLDNIDFSVEKGEFITIIGPNGSGKSTLLKIISGLLKPLSGSVALNEKILNSFTPNEIAKMIAFVPQKNNSIFPYSVFEIVMMGRTPHLNFYGFEKNSDHDFVNEAIDLVGISELKNKGINEVSGGEAQSAFIARALVQQPELLLLDEPNAFLDIQHQITIFNLLKKMNKERGLTVIAVSHDLNLSGHYSDRIVLMQKGKIYLDDKKENVLTELNIKTVFYVNSLVDLRSDEDIVRVLITPESNSYLRKN
ncbi:MAG: ABC transporter ATP-binding protein [bacterium]